MQLLFLDIYLTKSHLATIPVQCHNFYHEDLKQNKD